MQNPLTQILFFAWIYNSFINSRLLEWLKVRQIKSGIRVNFDQCGYSIYASSISKKRTRTSLPPCPCQNGLQERSIPHLITMI